MKQEMLLGNFLPKSIMDSSFDGLRYGKSCANIVERVLDNGQMTDWNFNRRSY
jgi:hypothetical protein